MGPSVSQAWCTQKQTLLRAYSAALDTHSQDVRDYADAVQLDIDASLVLAAKRRMHESRATFIEARDRYSDHIREHGCEIGDGHK